MVVALVRCSFVACNNFVACIVYRIDPGTAYLLKIRLHGHHSRENFTYKIEEVVDSGRTNFKDFTDDIREKYP